ncbi:hypothetical protein ACFFRR_011808 [Megaselia abdita]
MNETGEPLTNGSTATPERPCVLTSYIPTLGMSCRGRAEAFARRLQSKLRTLGSQSDENSPEENGSHSENNDEQSTWITSPTSDQDVVTHLPTLRNDIEPFFDFDCELESPGSPVDECEYSRLIETASNTPLGTSLTSEFNHMNTTLNNNNNGHCNNHKIPLPSTSSPSSSPEDHFFDPENDSTKSQTTLTDYYDCEDAQKINSINLDDTATTISSAANTNLTNGYNHHISNDDDSGFIPNESSNGSAETLPQSDTHIQDAILSELCELSNGHKQTTELATDDTNLCRLDEKKEEKNHSSGIDTEDEEDLRPQRIRRCSSLKTGKTPPGTPGRKKFVRFADVLGLDLADVKTFMDEIPSIPKSAFEDLEITEPDAPIQLGPKADKILMPLFQQPGGLPNFLDAVREKQVSLENAAISDHFNLTISGSVRVRNLDFHKSVHIRYSLDGWRSFADLQANYVQNSCDGFSDTFTFVMFGNTMHIGQRLEFAVRFQCKGQQFWDNNYGANYCFQCLPATNTQKAPPHVQLNHHSTPVALISPGAGESWCASFY